MKEFPSLAELTILDFLRSDEEWEEMRNAWMREEMEEDHDEEGR